ncbi:MAG: hypothetical protein HGA81_03425 [Chlorobium limicola]|uniref:Uncharacterized protein n=1 Tax=Chlorobium limicola (strain DSM 245 / NBRC 103803 / 6330) TaxID=290315 RepID=B3ECC0_CHLL2|nr:hypothetical protein [Chlorobium limicola]ACD90195.1 hypothetical protein Clim_1126 [Chlorobium limicola DSM 245]NTV07641.1 hypothetical protein [Chlorobium limicola]
MESGFGAEASYLRHLFDGKRYVRKERIGGAKAHAGKPCLFGEVTCEKPDCAQTDQLNGSRFQDDADRCFAA